MNDRGTGSTRPVRWFPPEPHGSASRRAAAQRARALTMPLVANDCRVAVGGIAFLEGRPRVAADLLAALTTGSASYNTLGVLLRHYQQRTRAALSPSEWERAAHRITTGAAWRLIETELEP